MAAATFKCEFPRRQAMLSLWDKYIEVDDRLLPDPMATETRVPVFVWPMPTNDGRFVVERQDGRCHKAEPYELTFLDGKKLFEDYVWRDAKDSSTDECRA